MKKFKILFVVLLALAAPTIWGAIASRLCIANVGCLTGDGTDVFLDADGDGTLDPFELNLTVNAPNAAGDETVSGNLTLVGELIKQGANADAFPFEAPLWSTLSYDANIGGDPTPIPAASQCLSITGGDIWNYTGGSSTLFRLPFKAKITRFAAVQQWNTNSFTGNCTFTLINNNTSQNLASISFGPSGQDIGNTNGVAAVKTVPTGVSTWGAGQALQLCADAACNPGGWNRVYFYILGYGVD